MNPDVSDGPTGDTIGRHLTARANAIDLPRTSVGAITERADRRRRRRRTATLGGAAAFLLAGTTAALVLNGDGGREEPLATTPDALVESPLDWTTVEPAAGLAWTATSGVATDDGAVYRLSTLPGPARNLGDAAAFANRTLYRSADGAEWEQLTLPDTVYAAALASDGARLYAVGTGPVGGDGGTPLRLTASDDGGATWSTPIDIGADLSALKAEYGHEIVFGLPSVAAAGGTTVVAVTVHAIPDIAERVTGVNTEWGWRTTPEGVVIFGEPPPCDDPNLRCPEPPVVANLTWDQVDLPEELRALLTPEVHLFVAGADGTFEEVEPPVGSATYAPVVAADGTGFSLFVNEPAGEAAGREPMVDPMGTPTRRFTSADGRSWAAAASLPLYVNAAGIAGGTGMVAGWAPDGQRTVLAPLDGGEIVDPLAFLGGDGDQAMRSVIATGFGPMGWAVLVADEDDGGNGGNPTAYTVVHSNRGSASVSVVPLPADVFADATATGITVTADAISVRFTANADGDPSTVSPQRLWVGTPRG